MTKKNSFYHGVDKTLFYISKYISYISAITLFIIMVVATADVIGTKILKSPIRMSTEIVTWGNVLITFLSVAYVQMDAGHITITLIVERFPKVIQLILREIGNVLGTVTTALITRYAFTRTISDYASHTRADTFDTFLVWPFCCAFAIGALLLTVCFAWSIIRDFYRYKHPEVLQQEGGDEE